MSTEENVGELTPLNTPLPFSEEEEAPLASLPGGGGTPTSPLSLANEPVLVTDPLAVVTPTNTDPVPDLTQIGADPFTTVDLGDILGATPLAPVDPTNQDPVIDLDANRDPFTTVTIDFSPPTDGIPGRDVEVPTIENALPVREAVSLFFEYAEGALGPIGSPNTAPLDGLPSRDGAIDLGGDRLAGLEFVRFGDGNGQLSLDPDAAATEALGDYLSVGMQRLLSPEEPRDPSFDVAPSEYDAEFWLLG